MGGCEVDSYLDPSVIGRWEHTPTVVPILDRIASIEEKEGEYVEVSGIQPEDMQPEASEYRLGPGDKLQIRVRDLYVIGQDAMFEPTVNQRGLVVVPGYAPIRAYGLTDVEFGRSIAKRISDAGIIAEPTVDVQVLEQRQLTFNVLGDVRNPGTFFIPEADYRLLEAITAAGGLINEQDEEVLVIRQVALSDSARGIIEQPEATNAPTPAAPQKSGEEIIDLIDTLSPATKPKEPSPSIFGGRGSEPPAIDLIEPPGASAASPAASAPPAGSPSWSYVNGQWVRTGAAAPQPTDELSPLRSTTTAGDIMTQRVIRVPVAALLSGAAQYNIVVRPGDIVRIPTSPRGFVYVGGEVSRPGVFNLPTSGRLTLLRAFTSAGGLGERAIPERVDLYRMVGRDRQAIIRLNGKAIASGTQPDIFLKPDDHIVVGTNFWAFPLAVLRNGFRMSYGFGFLLDRNFGNDVFGPPPTDRGFSN